MANASPAEAITAPVLRRKRNPLSLEAVEAKARQCVIGDFNRFSDYCKIRQTMITAKSLKNAAPNAITQSDERDIAKAFVEMFEAFSLSSQKAVVNLTKNDFLYNSRDQGSSLASTVLATLVNKMGPGVTNPQLFTPNLSPVGQESNGRPSRASPFEVATERLPLEVLSPNGSSAPSSNITAIVKNLPARTQVQHRYAARTVGWQQTSAYVIAGIGCFATFASGYFGFYHNRAVLAATPLFALITLSGFNSFELTQDRSRYSSHAESISRNQ